MNAITRTNKYYLSVSKNMHCSLASSFLPTLATPYSKTLAHKSQLLHFNLNAFGSSMHTYMNRFVFESISSTKMNGENRIMELQSAWTDGTTCLHKRENKRIFVCIRLPFFICLFVWLLFSLGCYAACARGMLTNNTARFIRDMNQLWSKWNRESIFVRIQESKR